MKKILALLAIVAALLLTAWSTYRLTMHSLTIELDAEAGAAYVTAFGMTDIYSLEDSEQ